MRPIISTPQGSRNPKIFGCAAVPASQRLNFLLPVVLNHACAEKEKAGEKITAPGLPLPPEEHAEFITEDCIEAPKL